jgi:hypothetical protein
MDVFRIPFPNFIFISVLSFYGVFNVIFCFLWVSVFLSYVSISLHFPVLKSYDIVCGSA